MSKCIKNVLECVFVQNYPALRADGGPRQMCLLPKKGFATNLMAKLFLHH